MIGSRDWSLNIERFRTKSNVNSTVEGGFAILQSIEAIWIGLCKLCSFVAQTKDRKMTAFRIIEPELIFAWNIVNLLSLTICQP